MGEFLQVCPKRLCISTVGKRTDLFARDPAKVPITDFFGSVRNVELTLQTENLTTVLLEGVAEKTIGTASSLLDNGDHCTKDNCKEEVLYQYFDELPILKEL